jgi:hypothetical protein
MQVMPMTQVQSGPKGFRNSANIPDGPMLRQAETIRFLMSHFACASPAWWPETLILHEIFYHQNKAREVCEGVLQRLEAPLASKHFQDQIPSKMPVATERQSCCN